MSEGVGGVGPLRCVAATTAARMTAVKVAPGVGGAAGWGSTGALTLTCGVEVGVRDSWMETVAA
jgi:hypothetical protein